eukprot:448927-Prorocentrum_minimum.AAC.1
MTGSGWARKAAKASASSSSAKYASGLSISGGARSRVNAGSWVRRGSGGGQEGVRRGSGGGREG